MVVIEGCATVSDQNNGDLLFYTDGLKIWDRTHQIMPNGSGLLSGLGTSSTQGVLIVPYPEQLRKYYVFTVDETAGGTGHGFRYSVVDLSLNNGLGDVDTLRKNVWIQGNATERLSVTYNADATGYWVMMHERGNAVYKAYEVTKAGISAVPVESMVGSIHDTVQQVDGDGTIGCMSFNEDGSKLAVAIYSRDKIEVLDFDRCSGAVSNAKTLATVGRPYGVAFSSNRLYYSVYEQASFAGGVFQCTIDASSQITAPVVVGVSSSANFSCVGALQKAPDGKIYLSVNNEQWLSAISKPDSPGLACNFIDKAILLPDIGLSPTTGFFGLPQFVPNYDTVTNSRRTILISQPVCVGVPITFQLRPNQLAQQVLWKFEDGIEETGGPDITHTFSNAGLYNVQAVSQQLCHPDTLTLAVRVSLTCDSLQKDCDLKIPDAFSVNGDGKNDIWRVASICRPDSFHVALFNRWGQLIFQSSDVETEWDGSFHGVPCPSETYHYVLTYRFLNQEVQYKTGNVVLFR
ncbi:MAG: gliding motility-associated C-terminal domain-containing protein [Chitinophagales bacterium]